MDRVIFFGCVLLVLFGGFLGVSIDLSTDAYMAIKSALDVMAAVSTIAAAGVAVYALTAWRSEFTHSKKFDALARLKKAVDDLRVAPKYMRYAMLHAFARNNSNQENAAAFADALKDASSKWLSADKDFSSASDDCELFIVDARLRDLIVSQIEMFSMVTCFRDDLREGFFELEGVDESEVRKRYRSVEVDCLRCLDKLEILVGSLRSDLVR